MPQKKKPSRLDSMARAQGFPNYAAWKAWNEKYRAPVQGKTAPKNFLQTLGNKIADTIPIRFAERHVTAALKGAQRK